LNFSECSTGFLGTFSMLFGTMSRTFPEIFSLLLICLRYKPNARGLLILIARQQALLYNIHMYTNIFTAANSNGQAILFSSCSRYLLLLMVALYNRADHYIFALWFLSSLWSPYVIGRPYIFSSCDFYLSFFSSPNFSGRRLDVYHTSTHGVALVRI